MPRTSARLSSSRLNDAGAAKENQTTEPNIPAANRSKGLKVVWAPGPNQLGTSSTATAGRGRKNGSAASRSIDVDEASLCLALQEDNAHNHDLRDELQHMREERARLLAEIQNLRIQFDTSWPSQPSQSTTQTALIPYPQGRRINLQEDMQLANDRIRYLSICRTMKDVVRRAGLDCMVRWEYQPKEKLAKIFWLIKDRQPYLKRFANNWPIEEYIKRHHKIVCAYLRRIHNDGTNATLPDIDSDEISESDSQGEVPSDLDSDMYLADA